VIKAVAERFIQSRGQMVWNSFNRIRRRQVRVAASRYPVGFWSKVIEVAAGVGPDPVLLVPFNPIGNDISKWRYNAAPGDLNVEFRQGQPTGAGFGYMATIDGINVYAIRLPADRAWLFSGRILRSVRYSRLVSGNLVDLTFNEGDDPHNSSFLVHFAQIVEWNDTPVIELVLRSRTANQAGARVAAS
jgi:hypothetical protein